MSLLNSGNSPVLETVQFGRYIVIANTWFVYNCIYNSWRHLLISHNGYYLLMCTDYLVDIIFPLADKNLPDAVHKKLW